MLFIAEEGDLRAAASANLPADEVILGMASLGKEYKMLFVSREFESSGCSCCRLRCRGDPLQYPSDKKQAFFYLDFPFIDTFLDALV